MQFVDVEDLEVVVFGVVFVREHEAEEADDLAWLFLFAVVESDILAWRCVYGRGLGFGGVQEDVAKVIGFHFPPFGARVPACAAVEVVLFT